MNNLIHPRFIGICGGSASGKTTLARKLKEHLGADTCRVLSMDDFYIDFVRLGRNPQEINYDHPDSFDIPLLADTLTALKQGKSARIPRYDYASHRRSETMSVLMPCHTIILEGLFLFTLPDLNSFFTLRIYVETPDEIRLQRRIIRDVAERGRSHDSVVEQYTRIVRPMHEKYVSANRERADVCMKGDRPFEEQIKGILHLL